MTDCSNGKSHSVDEYPLFLAGTANAALQKGIHYRAPAGENASRLGLTLLNTLPDNFGTYAGDGVADDWQVVYFGQNNPLAAPQLDPDFDGHTNLFEYTAGLIPTDAASKFNWRIAPVPGQPSQKKLIFSPLVAGRTYTVKTATTLGTPMTTLTGSTFTDTGNERTVTDPAATGGAKFYSIEIVKP